MRAMSQCVNLAAGNLEGGRDVVAPLYAAKTDVGVKFTEIRQKEGERAALKWRRDQFAQYQD